MGCGWAEDRGWEVKAGPRQALPGRGARRVRVELAASLKDRLEEIEEAVLARVNAIADSGEVVDPTYAGGLRQAIRDALEYAVDAIERDVEHASPVPVSLLAQARLAARNRVGIDTVLRRYLAGYTLLGDFLVEEAIEVEVRGSALKGLLRTQAATLDRLLTAVSEEYARETSPSADSAGRRRLRLVRRLLSGESVDAGKLRYPCDAHHLGLVVFGLRAEELAGEIGTAADRSLLAVSPEPGTVWAWLGGAAPTDADELCELAEATAPTGTTVAVGEAAKGLAGWRLTHRQAVAALPIARQRDQRAVRYVDVALLVSALGDELTATALRRFYLEPLERGRDGGAIARETLRAYFATGRNVSSAAAMLRISRTTAASRLRAIEVTIGRSLSSCAAELEIALSM